MGGTQAMRKTTRHGDELALLGKTKEGDKVYLKKAEYACDWYFSFGVLEIYEENKAKPSTITHWNSYFTGNSHVEPSDIKDKLVETPFEDETLWIICDWMKTCYALKQVSGIYDRGNSHLSRRTHGEIQDEDKKREIDHDTYRIINNVHKAVGFQKPDEIANLPRSIRTNVDLQEE
jgi:hypothetical protein